MQMLISEIPHGVRESEVPPPAMAVGQTVTTAVLVGRQTRREIV